MLKIKDNVPIKKLIELGYEVTDTFEDKPKDLQKGNCIIELYDEIYKKWNTRIIYTISVFQLLRNIYKDKPYRLQAYLENELFRTYYKLNPKGDIYH